MPFLMQAPAPDILLRQQPDGVDLVGFDDTLDHPLDVGLPFVYKGIMHLLSAKRDIWTCDGVRKDPEPHPNSEALNLFLYRSLQ